MISNSSKNKGQALVEFSLALGVLLLLVFGILEFGRVLFAYSSASDSLRSALRNASILGVEDGSSTRPYLDCADMQSKAQNNFFTGTQTITIQYQKTDGSGSTFSCDGVGDPQATDSDLANGDLLVIDLDTTISPLWFRFVDHLDMHLKGQRTIVKLIVPGAGVGDEDFDGLADDWEISHFGTTDEINATDDPDGDGCNNGCEEDAGTDPNDNTSFPSGIGNDPDGDGIETVGLNPDNCPTVANTDQLDSDFNGVGDACEDADGDGTYDPQDTCPGAADLGIDTDGDGIDNACDPDIDGDGNVGTDNCPYYYDPGNTCPDPDGDLVYGTIAGSNDNCPNTYNPQQENTVTPNDSTGDACEDPDGDGVYNDTDNCPSYADTTNACLDSDGDGKYDGEDNCPTIANPDQIDDNPANGIGDACEGDTDLDGVKDVDDNCPFTTAADYSGPLALDDQTDTDGDGIGNICDADDDNDGVDDDAPDNCPLIANTNQADNDGDQIGDLCDPDDDNDSVVDTNDNCQIDYNPYQEDYDSDGTGDLCDADDDNDGVDDTVDNCPLTIAADYSGPLALSDQTDSDNDGEGDICDATPNPAASITVTLRETNSANCNFTSTYYSGSVTITQTGATPIQYPITVDSSGTYSLTNLPDGTYEVDPPGTAGGKNLTAEEDNNSCFGSSIADPVQNIVLTNGVTYSITFGYK